MVRQGTEKVIRFGRFNIRNGQNRGIESAFRGMAQGRVDCGVIQETNLTKGVYMQEYSGFWVMAIEALIAHHGGVAILYCEVEHFAIEELRLHCLNFMIFQLVTGQHQWHVVRCYISPSDASIIEDVSAATPARIYRSDLLVAGSLNANISDPEGKLQGKATADKLVAVGLLDTGLHFLPCCKPWLTDRCTWIMQRDG